MIQPHTNQPEHGKIGNFYIPRILQKSFVCKISVFILFQRVDIFNGNRNFLLKTVISIAENWLNKKNHTEHKYSVFFESQNNNIKNFK